MNADIVPLSSLETDAKNANRGTERGRYALERSLEKLGAGRSILLDKNGKIIAGNKTAETAGEMGIEDVVIVRTTGDKLVAVMREDLDLDEVNGRARELAYADNRVGQLDLEFDPAVIAFDLEAGLDLSDWWQEDELTLLTADIGGGVGEAADAEPQVSRADELQQAWGTQLGQLWKLPSRTAGQCHYLICGDCTDKATVERVMMGERVKNFLSDPPYGIAWDTDYTRFGGEYDSAKRVNYSPVENDNKPFDPRPYLDFDKVILWGANWYCQNIPLGSWFVWDKRHPSGEAWLSDAEIAWSKGKQGVYIYAETVQGAHRKEKAMHPTQKPVGLFSWCIEKAGMEGIVCDFFSGSGTTLIAAENLSRQCRAIEISPAYVAVALQRYADAFQIRPELVP